MGAFLQNSIFSVRSRKYDFSKQKILERKPSRRTKVYLSTPSPRRRLVAKDFLFGYQAKWAKALFASAIL